MSYRKDETKPLIISFSGGKTSALMTLLLIEKYKGKREIYVVFANTSRERAETYEFINNCDTHFNFNTVWIEAVVNPEHKKPTTHRVTDYYNAKKNGEVFESVINKYGIPNSAFPHCTRELKVHPINSYLKSLDLKEYVTAIGIRADEPRRLNWEKAEKFNYIYPLAETWRVSKKQVNTFWLKQPFTLNLKEHEGNCDLCWKKSRRKLLTLIYENPNIVDWWLSMELQYSNANIENRNTEDFPPPYYFFRDNTSTQELIEEAGLPFSKYIDTSGLQGDLFSAYDDIEDDGCTNSCEPF